MKDFAVVILAAGHATRVGMPKGLVPVDGKPWLWWQLEALRALGFTRPVVVLGLSADEVLRGVPALAQRATFLRNPDPDRGPFSSLQVGLAAVASPAFVLPVDTPCAEWAVWDRLAGAVRGCGAFVSVPRHGERGGHPVCLSRSFSQALLALPPSHRLDEAIRALPPSAVTAVTVQDPSVLANLNTLEDFRRQSPGRLFVLNSRGIRSDPHP